MIGEQIVRIPLRTIAFTAVCEACVEQDGAAEWFGSTFGGRLDLDVDHGTFLCRRGHPIRVERDAGRYRDRGFAAA